jgi:hypothetical protein
VLLVVSLVCLSWLGMMVVLVVVEMAFHRPGWP